MKRMFLVLGTAIVILPFLAGASVHAGPIYWTATGQASATIDGSGQVNSNTFPGQSASFVYIQFTEGEKTNGMNAGSAAVTGLTAGFLNASTQYRK